MSEPHRRTSSRSLASFLSLDTTVKSDTSNLAHSPSKDKDKIRHWVFPRTPSLSGASSSSPEKEKKNGPSMATKATGAYFDGFEKESKRSGSSLGSIQEGPHWVPPPTLGQFANTPLPSYSPSPSTSSSPKFESRHKLNTSIAYNIPPSYSHPSDLLRMAYTNLRRKSLSDLLYLAIFFSSVFIFFGALSGHGYVLKETSENTLAFSGKAKVGRRWPVVHDPTDVEKPVDVEIPKGFLPAQPGGRDEMDVKGETRVDADEFELEAEDPVAEEDDAGPVPADVHQPHGDSSHDAGEDLMKDSLDDPSLDDENVHDVQVQRGKAALFAGHRDASTSLESGESQADESEEEEDHAVFHSDDAATHAALHFADEDDEAANAHEDSFDANPPELLQPDAVAAVAAAMEEEAVPQQPQQHLGDSFRRPNTPEGIAAMKEGREKIVRERERWLENMREAAVGVAEQGEKKKVMKRLMR